MPEFTLWYFPGACSLAPHIILRETGQDFKLNQVRVETKPEAFSITEDYRAINPKMKVPAVSVDGTIVTELPAVMTLIARLAQRPDLLGKSPLEMAQVIEWMNWLSGTLHGQGYGALWQPFRFLDDPALFGGLRKKGRATIEGCYDFIEQRLSGEYAVGGSYTVVDPYLYVFWLWGQKIELDMEARYPKYAVLVSAVAKREPTKAALSAEGIEN